MDCVSTMLLNPRHATKVGFYSLFVYAQHLAELNGLSTVSAINEIGNDDIPTSLASLKNGLGIIGSASCGFWHDVQIQQSSVDQLVLNLKSKGRLVETVDAIESCECGKIQYRSQAKLRKTKSSLLSLEGLSLCCSSQICKQDVSMLVTSPCQIPERVPKLHPAWAQKEFDWIYSELSGQQLMISRTDTRHFSVTMKSGSKLWLDTDLVSMFLSWFMNVDGITIKYLISGISTMRLVAIMILFANWLDMEVPQQIHFLPRVDFQPIPGVDTLDSAVNKYGSNRVRNALLWSALCQKQAINLPGSIFHRMSPDKLDANSLGLDGRRQLLISQ